MKNNKAISLFLLCFLLSSLVFIQTVYATTVNLLHWNKCEQTADWNLGTDTTIVEDNSDYMEGIGSIHIQSAVGGNRLLAKLNFSTTNVSDVFSFWLKFDLNTTSSCFIVFRDASGYYMGIDAYRVGATFQVRSIIYDGVTGLTGTYQNVVANNWYWFEFRNTVAKSFTYWMNGSEIQTLTGANQLSITSFQIIHLAGGTGGTFHIDYVREADIEEFPPTPPPPPRISFDLLTINWEGCGNWVFAQEKYYNFNVTQSHNVSYTNFSYVELGFSDNFYWANVSYNVATKVFNLMSGSEIVRLQTGSTGNDANDTLWVNFPIWFTDKVHDVYASNCVDVYWHANGTDGQEYGWELVESDFFKIYNQGGYSLNYTHSGNGYRILGGDVFEFYASNASEVYSNLVYRNLQHVKYLVDAQCLVGYSVFDCYFGIDYCTAADDWLNGYYLRLSAVNVTYPSVIGGGEKYFAWTANWFFNNTLLESEDIAMFHQGNVAAVGEQTYSRFWVDLWFSQTNSSSWFGLRVNAYEYPMTDDAPVYLKWLTTDWGINENRPKESLFFGQLKQSDNSILYADQIKMVRAWVKLYVGSDPSTNQTARLFRYEVFDKTFCNPPLKGIQTPVFDETKVPVMPQGGFLGSISAAFASLGKWLADNIIWGGLSVWPAFVAFLDTIAYWLGFPNGFSLMIGWLSTYWGWLVLSVTDLTLLLVQMFLFLASILTYIVSLVTLAVSSWISVITGLISFLSGGYGTGVDLWNLYNLSMWVTIGVILYPLYLIFLWDEKGGEAVLNQLMFIFNVLNMLVHFFLSIAQFVINLIGRIIESIPVVE